MEAEPIRSRQARVAAEAALIRVVHHYGSRPEFVLIGGLVPELLCRTSPRAHAGTTDIDVQVNLEIAAGSVNAARLEQALKNAEFEPDAERIWRWRGTGGDSPAIVKFELLADLDDQSAGATIEFNGCEELGAANLRGTGFAARDFTAHTLSGTVDGAQMSAKISVTGLAGFLLAKAAAAFARRLPKDWYDIAFVLLNNDQGGPEAAATAVRSTFSADLPAIRPMIDDMAANFADLDAQGPAAYASQVVLDHSNVTEAQAKADAVLALDTFVTSLEIS